MREIEGACMVGEPWVAVKGRGNFRKDLYPQYKANRKPLDPDLAKALAYGHEYMLNYHNALPADGMEADDLVSIWAWEARADDIPYFIVGIDKDLRQIPGNHYNFVRKTHEFIDDFDAQWNLMIQCLTGDNADNIPGIRGVGPKKAEKILNVRKEISHWDKVFAAWKEHNPTGDPFMTRRLVSMLKSWKELDEIQSKIKNKTNEPERSMATEGVQEVQEPEVQTVPDSDI